MMRAWLCVGVFLSMAGLGRGADWVPLFNGRDLSGWRANRDPEAFQIRDGVLRIQSSSKTRAHLFYVGDRKEGFENFKDFDLQATVRAEPGSNGGIFVHTDMTTRDKAQHLARGYEIQLNSAPTEKRKTGSLYAIVDLAKSPVEETEWFVVDVAVRGKRIRIAIDDQEVVNYTEPENVERPPERAGRLFALDGGAIALQAHDPGSVWYFKDIRVRRAP